MTCASEKKKTLAISERASSKDIKSKTGGSRTASAFSASRNDKKTKVLPRYNGTSEAPAVLCICEKPSVAKQLAMKLTKSGKYRVQKNEMAPMCKIFHLHCYFPPARAVASVAITSVLGHLLETTFDGEDKGNPGRLYRTPVRKNLIPEIQKLGIDEHLRRCASEAEYIFLWLDCDREGENICQEILDIVRRAPSCFAKEDERVYRAKFSSLAGQALRNAWAKPGRPDHRQAVAVDVRQELDLKIGCSFTRFFTRNVISELHSSIRNEVRVMSYGPCQTPTLYFVVQRQMERDAFIPRDFYCVTARAAFSESVNVDLTWPRGNVNSKASAKKYAARARKEKAYTVASVRKRTRREKPPNGLNTVALLQAASRRLGLGPNEIMKCCEKLYIEGCISYPRTESTAYDCVDLALLSKFVASGQWRQSAMGVLDWASLGGMPRGGQNEGDHPPITPVSFPPKSIRGKFLQIYKLIVNHWLASLSGPFVYTTYTVDVSGGRGLKFAFNYDAIEDMGWCHAASHRRKRLNLHPLLTSPPKKGSKVRISNVEVVQGTTEAPRHLERLNWCNSWMPVESALMRAWRCILQT